MKFVKKILDSNDSHIVLTPLLNICLTVAKYFPAVFKDDFLVSFISRIRLTFLKQISKWY